MFTCCLYFSKTHLTVSFFFATKHFIYKIYILNTTHQPITMEITPKPRQGGLLKKKKKSDAHRKSRALSLSHPSNSEGKFPISAWERVVSLEPTGLKA